MTNGLATLNAGQLRIMRRLDEVLLHRATERAASEIGFPPLSSVSSLERIAYFQNFPHLGLAVSPMRQELLPDLASARLAPDEMLPSTWLAGADYVLPSAACYPIYPHLRDQVIANAVRLTTVQRCFRNEERYEGLTRLRAFTMREVVAVGSQEEVKRFLAEYKSWILTFAEGARIALSVQVASDPFFERKGNRAKMQLLFPVKEEFVFENAVALASVNFHRNFFSECWGIRTPDLRYAFSGCVAFGLERWLHALSSRYENDCDAILAAIDAAISHEPTHATGP